MARSASHGVLLDHTRDKIVLLDEDGQFTYVNAAAERLLGFEPQQLEGQNAFEYVHPDDVDIVKNAFETTIASDSFTEVTVEYRHRTEDDSWVWLESRMSNPTDSTLEGFVVSSRDITDRIEAERERREAAIRLEEIAARSGDVLWMFDGDWTELLFVNPAYEEVYGMPIEELERSPQRFLETIHPDDVPAVKDAMECLSAGNPVDIEYRVNADEDYGRYVWVQGEPIVEDGDVVRIAGFTRDITDRRRRERQLYVMDNLLRHNLRNDLNVIMGAAEIVESEFPETSTQTAVIRRTGTDLLRSAEKERDIIDLLTTKTRREEIDLGKLLETCAETVRDRFPDATIDVSGDDRAVVRVLSEIRIAMIELFENAIRHSGTEDPVVRVKVRTTGDRVAIVFEDESPPLPEVEANVLTGDHEMTDIYHSSGLGLWLVYWCVDLSNGEITVQSPEDGHNRITVTLPGN